MSTRNKQRVLFVCIQNSGRSQIAEALLVTLPCATLAAGTSYWLITHFS